MKKNELEDENKVEENLSKIEPTSDDFINRRINHLSFAKVVYWLCAQSRKADFVYASELKQFMKFTQTRAYMVLKDLCSVSLLERREASANLLEFRFVKNDGHAKIMKYLGKAKKTLGLE